MRRAKESAIEVINQLPDDSSWEVVLYALQVRSDIEAGIADVEAGRTVDGDKVMSWLSSKGEGAEIEQELPEI